MRFLNVRYWAESGSVRRFLLGDVIDRLWPTTAFHIDLSQRLLWPITGHERKPATLEQLKLYAKLAALSLRTRTCPVARCLSLPGTKPTHYSPKSGLFSLTHEIFILPLEGRTP